MFYYHDSKPNSMPDSILTDLEIKQMLSEYFSRVSTMAKSYNVTKKDACTAVKAQMIAEGKPIMHAFRLNTDRARQVKRENFSKRKRSARKNKPKAVQLNYETTPIHASDPLLELETRLVEFMNKYSMTPSALMMSDLTGYGFYDVMNIYTRLQNKDYNFEPVTIIGYENNYPLLFRVTLPASKEQWIEQVDRQFNQLRSILDSFLDVFYKHFGPQ